MSITQYEGVLSKVDENGNVAELYPLVYTDKSLEMSGRPADAAAVKAEINRLDELIKIRPVGRSFISYQHLVLGVVNEDKAKPRSLIVGQSIYVLTPDVPDLWVYNVIEAPGGFVNYKYVDDESIINEIKENGTIQIGYYEFAMMETTAVDLSSLSVTRATLAAGETTITIEDSRINDNSILSFYTSVYGLSPLSVTVDTGTVTLIFTPQENEIEVGVRVDG